MCDDDKRSARYIRRRYLVSCVRLSVIVGVVSELLLGTGSYVGGRANGLGFHLPIVGATVPLVISAGLGCVALCVCLVLMRPRASVVASVDNGNRPPARGGYHWPGPAAVGGGGGSGLGEDVTG